MREIEGRLPDDLEAEPIPVSVARLTDKVAKRKGYQAVAVCTHCRDGLYMVKIPKGPWLHASTGSRICNRTKAQEWKAFETKWLTETPEENT